MKLRLSLLLLAILAGVCRADKQIEPETLGCFAVGDYHCTPDLSRDCAALKGSYRIKKWVKVASATSDHDPLWAPEIEYYCTQKGIWNINTQLRHSSALPTDGVGKEVRVVESTLECYKDGNCDSVASTSGAVLYWIAPIESSSQPEDDDPPPATPPKTDPKNPLPIGWTPVYASTCSAGSSGKSIGTTIYSIKGDSAACNGKKNDDTSIEVDPLLIIAP